VTVLLVPVRTGTGATHESSLPPGVSAVAAVSPSPPGNPVAAQPAAQRDPNRPFTVSVFGDSIAWTLMHYLPATPGFDFVDHTVIGCSLVRGGPYKYLGQTLDPKPECDAWPSRWSAQISRDRPDVALLIIGRWETVDRVNEGEKPNGSLWPEDQPERVDQWNTMLHEVIAQHPNIGVLDLNKKLCPRGVYTAKVDGVQVRSDGVHLTQEGVEWLTPWLEESVR
jgi:hypothetical protein